MSDVFISYSRNDLSFVADLRKLLETAGFTVWVDIEGLYAGEEFWPEVSKAVDAAVALVFVISPDSIASKYCNDELVRAVAGHKRIVPVLRHDVATLHEELAKRQWVLFRVEDDPLDARNALLSAVRADWERLREEARILAQASEWQSKGRDDSLLLRGPHLRSAQAWLSHAQAHEGPAPLSREYVLKSMRAARTRRMRLAAISVATLVVVLVVGWFGIEQWVGSLSNLSLDDMRRHQPKAAIEKLARADAGCVKFASLFEGCANVVMNLGEALLEDGRYEHALTQFSRLLGTARDVRTSDEAEFRATAYQNRTVAHVMLAELQLDASLRTREYDLAAADLEQAVDLYRRTKNGLSGRPIGIVHARIHIGRGEYSQALDKLERAGRDSNAHNIHDIDLLLSAAYHCIGDGEKSLRHLQVYMNKLPRRNQDPHWLMNKRYYDGIRQRCTANAAAR